MQIELRRISYSAALSQETAAFSAEVWIEGELAFHARNQGTGGADFYHQVGRWTVAEVDAWLAPFRHFWSAHVDALERHLDRMEQSSKKGKNR